MEIKINSESGRLRSGKLFLLNYKIETLQISGSRSDSEINSFFEKIAVNTKKWLENDLKKRLEIEAASGGRRARLDKSLPCYSQSVRVESAGADVYKVTLCSRLANSDKIISFLLNAGKKRPLFVRIKPNKARRKN